MPALRQMVPASELWRITLLSLQVSGTAVANAFGRSISEAGAVLVVGGNIAGHTSVLTTAIVQETSSGRLEFALALGAVLLGLPPASTCSPCVGMLGGRCCER